MQRFGRIALIIGLGAAAMVGMLLYGPIPQDPAFHRFADERTLWGVPNFWNVASNLPLLVVALWGLPYFRRPEAFEFPWERVAYGFLLGGCALTAAGSGYYHWRPDDGTLFWDRLPMTLLFMSLLATTIGERISTSAGRILLFPLLGLGIGSVVWWHYSGDLRLYVFAQYFTMLVLPLMLMLFPSRYTDSAAMLGLLGFYGLAKLLELFDRQIGLVASTGGHPWKHVAAAAAIVCYVRMIARRRCIISSSP